MSANVQFGTLEPGALFRRHGFNTKWVKVERISISPGGRQRLINAQTDTYSEIRPQPEDVDLLDNATLILPGWG